MFDGDGGELNWCIGVDMVKAAALVPQAQVASFGVTISTPLGRIRSNRLSMREAWVRLVQWRGSVWGSFLQVITSRLVSTTILTFLPSLRAASGPRACLGRHGAGPSVLLAG